MLRLGSWVVVVLCIACTGSGEREVVRDAPALDVVSRVGLSEHDTLFVAQPGLGFFVDPAGQLFVADDFQMRVVAYSGDGRAVQTFGRRGARPGEFQSFQRFTFVRDGLLLQATGGRIKGFDVASGQYLGQVPHNRAYFSGVAVLGDVSSPVKATSRN